MRISQRTAGAYDHTLRSTPGHIRPVWSPNADVLRHLSY